MLRSTQVCKEKLIIEEHAKHPHSPYLFVSPKTGTMFDPDSFRHTHEKILKAIGAEHIRFHDLRHTFATLSLKYGVDVKTLSVTEVEEGDELTLQLRVAPEDMGKVIGRQGRIAKEIRTVVRSYAQRTGAKVSVDIVD